MDSGRTNDPAWRFRRESAHGPGAVASNRLFAGLGRLVVARPRLVIAGWLLLAALVSLASPSWRQTCQDDDIRFLPGSSASVQGYAQLTAAFPQETFGSKLIVALEATVGTLTDGDLEQMRHLQNRLEELRKAEPELGLGAIRGPGDPLVGSRLISGDRRAALVVVALQSPFLAARTKQTVDRIEELIRSEQPKPAGGVEPRLLLTGPAGVGRDLNVALVSSLHGTTWATVALVLLTLLAVYRAPLLALIPLVSIGLAVWIANDVLLLLAGWGLLQVVNLTPVFVVVLLFGAGTDYCLFLLSRCREERGRTGSLSEAVAQALTQVGGPLAASALAVMVGLGMLGFAEFVKLRVMGAALAVSLAIALLACLTLTPALLLVCGDRAFWPRLPRPRLEVAPDAERSAAWSWLERQLGNRPGVVWRATMAVLLPLFILGWCTSSSYSVKQDLPAAAPSLDGLAVIERAFQPGEIGPVTLLLTQTEPWTTSPGLARLWRVTEALRRCPGVAEVRSLVEPLGGQTASEAEDVTTLLPRLLLASAAQSVYLGLAPGGHVARIEIVARGNPLDAETFDVLPALEAAAQAALADPGPPTKATERRWFGMPVILNDVVQLQRHDAVLVFSLVLASIYAIMTVLLRRPGLALYLLATVIFSYYVTLGLTQLANVAWFDGSWGRLDWKVLFFLFTILVAVGADYNIFLMSRVIEERQRHGWRQGVFQALRRTGTTITSCGLIMAGTFATLMLTSLHTLQQLGLALALGVLVDTFIVRFLLVPSFLLWRRSDGTMLGQLRWPGRRRPGAAMALPSVPPSDGAQEGRRTAA